MAREALAARHRKGGRVISGRRVLLWTREGRPCYLRAARVAVDTGRTAVLSAPSVDMDARRMAL